MKLEPLLRQVLPALRSFCIYSALGVVALYGLQATFFVAWFYFDQIRMQKNRNGLVWCYTHKDHKPNECSQVDYCQMFFEKVFSRVILSKIGKATVLFGTAALTAAAVWGVTNLRQEFNPIWFLPQSSYLFSFLSKTEVYYPQAGTRGSVFLGALDYPAELPKIYSLTVDMQEDPDISSVNSWYLELANYTRSRFKVDIKGKALNESFFNQIMGKFIFSAAGARYQSYFNFNGNISCGQDTPAILASKFDYQHGVLGDRDEQIAAMDLTKALVANQNFSDFAAPVAMLYSSWETDKVIAVELVRNLTLALVAVLVMTLLLIVNVPTALCVFFCVTLTLVDVMALMTWWGLTIDTVTCINLVLCIGLCVDYSAHIGLHFMQVEGSRDERVQTTLTEMAPPVLNGAVSTFLAFVLLANSDSHVFTSFFKIFFGVFVFGVFHGLVFLPVLLSLVGPVSYATRRAALLPESQPLKPVPHAGPVEQVDAEVAEAAHVSLNVSVRSKPEAVTEVSASLRSASAGADTDAEVSGELTALCSASSLGTGHESSSSITERVNLSEETLKLDNETLEKKLMGLNDDEVGNTAGGRPVKCVMNRGVQTLINNQNVVASSEQPQRQGSQSNSVELSDENSDEEWKQQITP